MKGGVAIERILGRLLGPNGCRVVQRSNHLAIIPPSGAPLLVPDHHRWALGVALKENKHAVWETVDRFALHSRQGITSLLRDDMWTWFYREGGREASINRNYGGKR